MATAPKIGTDKTSFAELGAVKPEKPVSGEWRSRSPSPDMPVEVKKTEEEVGEGVLAAALKGPVTRKTGTGGKKKTRKQKTSRRKTKKHLRRK